MKLENIRLSGKKKPDIKGKMLNDLFYMKCLEEANPY